MRFQILLLSWNMSLRRVLGPMLQRDVKKAFISFLFIGLEIGMTNNSARAKEGVLPGSSEKDPVIIEAVRLDVGVGGEKLVYTGDVLVVNGPSTLRSMTMTLFMLPKELVNRAGSTNDRIKNVEADGSVLIDTKKDIYGADHLSYDKGQNKIYLNGNVSIKQKDSLIKSNSLVYDKSTERALLTGQVLYVAKDTSVTGDKMDYDRKNNKAIITGNVTYTKKDAVVRGNKMTYDLNKSEGFVENTDNSTRVKAIFTPGTAK